MTNWIISCGSVEMEDMLGVISGKGGGIVVKIGDDGGNDGGRW